MTAAVCVSVPAFETVSELKGVDPPTMPVRATTPPEPPFKTNAEPPLIVEENVMFAPAAEPLVVSAVTAPVKLTGPVKEIAAPLVVRFPPKLMSVGPV